MAIALARKYRPKRFSDVAVQSHVSTTLRGAIARGRVAHGYLLCGPRGVGKTTLARVLAMALNCERRERAPEEPGGTGPNAATPGAMSSEAGEPCTVCSTCVRIWSGASSFDVVEIDAASNRGVDDARDLRERAMYAPSGDDRYKVYIVDEAHMLTREAWNALLKILEEPPPRVVFVFATTEPQKIAQAAAPVLSRLQRFDFKRIGVSDIKERLAYVLDQEHLSFEPDAVAMIARAADGSMRDALSLTDQVLALGDRAVDATRVREALGLVAEDEFIALLDLVADRRAADVFPFVRRLADAGVDFGGFLNGLADMLRAQLAVALGGSAADVSERARTALQERRSRWSAADLLRMLSALTELEPRFRKSGQQQLLVETLLVRFALLDRTVAIEELLRGLGGEGRGIDERRDDAREDLPKRPEAAVPPRRAIEPSQREADSRAPARKPPGEQPVPPRAAVLADRAEPVSAEAASTIGSSSGGESPLDLNRVAERWDELVSQLRADGKRVLASALEHALPVAVSGAGDLTIELAEPNEFSERTVETGRADIAAMLRQWFPSLQRVQLRGDSARGATAPPKRLTNEMLRSERLTALRKRDPILGAAIDALDLDVVD